MKFIKNFLPATLLLISSGQVFCQMMILSGPEKGSYTRFVGDMVAVLGANKGIGVANITSGGSAYNFKALTDPATNYKLALIQSDYLNLKLAEDKLNNTDKTSSLRVVMELATEEIHFIAKTGSGLVRLEDLEKKKVGIGSEDQGSFATGNTIRERSKLNWYTYHVGFEEMLKKLSEGDIDAGLIVGSAPVDMLDIDPQVLINGITLLELSDFNGWARYYENDTVYRTDYKWLDKDVPTFGVRTLLVVNESKLTPEEQQTVANIKSGIIENLGQLREQGHPKWKTVIIPDEPVTVLAKQAVVTPAPEPDADKVNESVLYRVQIYSRNYLREGDQVNIKGKNFTTYVYSYLGAYRYTIGEFTTRTDAVELQHGCREAGYDQAFVAAFKNNVRSTDPGLFK
jgi:TRAP transporter TAXI family solute receptor